VAVVALLFGLVAAGVGMLAFAAPERFLTGVRVFETPLGLYGAAAIRVVFGIALLGAAPASRAPRALRVLGAVVLLAGLLTPFVGVERARAIMDWWSARGAGFMRLWAAVAVAFGAFVVHAVRPARRGA
jgi:hypothetical protein